MLNEEEASDKEILNFTKYLLSCADSYIIKNFKSVIDSDTAPIILNSTVSFTSKLLYELLRNQKQSLIEIIFKDAEKKFSDLLKQYVEFGKEKTVDKSYN